MKPTINKYNLLTGLALFFIFGNSVLNLDALPTMHYLFSGMRVLFVGIAIMMILRRREVGPFTWMVGLFYLVWGYITYREQGAMNIWGSYCMNTIGISLWIYYSIKRSPEDTIRILCSIFGIFIYANFFDMILDTEDIFDGYILGHNYNQIGSTLLCGIITYSVAYKMQLKRLWNVLILCSICIITPIIVGSTTSTVGCLLVTAFLFIPWKRLRRITIISFIIFYILFQAIAVFLQNDLSKAKGAAYLIEEVMGKDLTFTNRTIVWLQAYDYAMDAPVMGYGARTPEWFEETFDVKTAHNILLQFMIYGGYVLLSVFALVMIICAIHAIKGQSPYAQHIGFGICAFFFMMIMETYNLNLIFYTMCLLFYSPNLMEKE